MKRLFIFGCSHVNYHYPTWADILIEQLSRKNIEGYNCGRCGGGNLLSAYRIWEIHSRFKFTKDDTIIISWTNFFREDRYHVRGGWHTPGNIFNTRNTYPFTLFNFTYTSEEDSHDLMHYLLRDCMLITSTLEGLKNTEANVYTTHMNDPYKDNLLASIDRVPEVLELYKPWVSADIDDIMSHCWYENLGQDDTRPRYRNELEPTVDIIEDHPLPLEHLDYLEKKVSPVIGEYIDDETRKYTRYWQDRLYQNDQGFYPLQDWHPKEPGWPFG